MVGESFPESNIRDQPWMRFISFVDSHAYDTDPLSGKEKIGEWLLHDPNQLVPINRVEFEVFHDHEQEDLDEPADIPQGFLGFAITYFFDDVELYELMHVKGEFVMYGADDQVVALRDSDNLAMDMINQLAILEVSGKLTPRSNTKSE